MPNRVIKSERARLGYNQQFIADKLGVSKSTYNLKENGKREFTETEMRILSIIFGKSLDELFFNDGVHKNETLKGEK